jgi:hypothetical protein
MSPEGAGVSFLASNMTSHPEHERHNPVHADGGTRQTVAPALLPSRLMQPGPSVPGVECEQGLERFPTFSLFSISFFIFLVSRNLKERP